MSDKIEVPRWAKMKDLGPAVRDKKIKIIHMSDDGQYCRLKILPNGPEVGFWMPDDLVEFIDHETMHSNMYRMMPFLFEKVTPPTREWSIPESQLERLDMKEYDKVPEECVRVREILK